MKKTRIGLAFEAFLTVLAIATLGPWPSLQAARRSGFEWTEGSVAVSQATTFRSAEVVSAADVTYPFQTTADGIVVFSVSVGQDGAVVGIKTLSDVPPLTDAAQSSLQSWKFKPALLNGSRENSQILVAFAFRHAIKEWTPPAFTPVTAPSQPFGYVPPGISAAAYCHYPTSTIAAGATVVQVTVRPDNSIGEVQVVRPLGGGFVPLAIAAAKQWQFQAAALDGTPLSSKVAIAFVFSSRAMNPF